MYLGNNGQALIYHNISRQQAVTMIGRAFGLAETEGELPYADGYVVQDYAKGYLLTMYNAGYITDVGLDRCFRPETPITRAEVVNLLNSMIAELFQDSGTYTENVEGTALVTAVDGAEFSNLTISGDLILAPGVTGTVTLRDVTLTGTVRNLGTGIVETITTPQEQPVEEQPAEDPEREYPWIEADRTAVDGNYKVPVYDDLERNTLTADDFYWDDRGRLVCTNEDFRTRSGIDVSAYQNRRCPNNTIDWEAVADDGLDLALEHEIAGPVAYDWALGTPSYRAHSLAPEIATAGAVAFCQRIEEAGYQPIVYMGKEVGYNKYNLPPRQD